MSLDRHIIYCIPHLYNAGGMERVLTQKVNWLVANTSYVITIVTTERTPDGMPVSYFPLDKRVQVVELNIDFNAEFKAPLARKFFAHIRKLRQYRRLLEQLILQTKADLCISLCGKEIAFLHRLPCRTIAETHFQINQRLQLIEATHKGWWWSFLGKIRTHQLVRAVKPLEQLVVLTETDREDWLAAGCTNVRCIPNPCSLKEPQNIKSPNPSDKKQVLAVGRLHIEKGFDLLLNAWQGIEKRHPEWSLRIVGEGDQRPALEAQIASLELQRVSLPGRSSEMEKEYVSADCFVLSSRYEGLPLALMEAMWCGVPCVAFDCPRGAKALIGDDRGWLVPNGDTDALNKQIEYTLMHEEEAMQRAKEAQHFVLSHYSEAYIMPQWVKLIEG